MVIKRFALVFLFTVLLLEVALRLLNYYGTYSEKIGKGYQSYYNQHLNSWYYNYGADTSFVADNFNFKYQYHTNSLGLRAAEFPLPVSDSAVRILALGDSFTEGVGAPADSAWPALLEADMRRKGVNAVVYNAGMGGTDPFYQYVFYRDKLTKYKPHAIILAINSSDITDYLFRGGFERFKPDGTTLFKKGPWYEPLWQHCHVVRFVMHTCLGFKSINLFIRRSQMQEDYTLAARQLVTACDSIRQLAQQNGCTFSVVLHPGPSEVMYKWHTVNLGFYKTTYMPQASQVLGQAFAIMESEMNIRHVPVVNLWDSFDTIINRQNYLQYTYEHDRHFNATGYNIMEGLIMNGLQPQSVVATTAY